jgi:deoxyadenosine/deoxycytidine kinase
VALRGHIAIEGVIGVGKTTLANRLAERLGGKSVLEAVEDNPFLPHFYRDREHYAFQTQLFFLLSRHSQQLELRQRDMFHDVVISDYIFQKDRIFANLNLSEHELVLYDRIARILEREIPAPDLVIYLQAPTSVLMDRIQMRGRPFERRMEVAYIQELNDAYNYFFFHYDAAPLLILNTAQIDFVRREDDFEDLVAQIERHKHGTAYYSPGGRI